MGVKKLLMLLSLSIVSFNACVGRSLVKPRGAELVEVSETRLINNGYVLGQKTYSNKGWEREVYEPQIKSSTYGGYSVRYGTQGAPHPQVMKDGNGDGILDPGVGDKIPLPEFDFYGKAEKNRKGKPIFPKPNLIRLCPPEIE